MQTKSIQSEFTGLYLFWSGAYLTQKLSVVLNIVSTTIAIYIFLFTHTLSLSQFHSRLLHIISRDVLRTQSFKTILIVYSGRAILHEHRVLLAGTAFIPNQVWTELVCVPCRWQRWFWSSKFTELRTSCANENCSLGFRKRCHFFRLRYRPVHNLNWC